MHRKCSQVQRDLIEAETRIARRGTMATYRLMMASHKRKKRNGVKVMYNYLESMKDDIRDFIECEGDYSDYIENGDFDRYGYEEHLNDELWSCDGITGNASGSYTFNSYEAGQNLVGNWDLLADAMTEFCCDCDAIRQGEEWADVTIRCYLLGQAIGEVLDEMENGEFSPSGFAELMSETDEYECIA